MGGEALPLQQPGARGKGPSKAGGWLPAVSRPHVPTPLVRPPHTPCWMRFGANCGTCRVSRLVEGVWNRFDTSAQALLTQQSQRPPRAPWPVPRRTPGPLWSRKKGHQRPSPQGCPSQPGLWAPTQSERERDGLWAQGQGRASGASVPGQGLPSKGRKWKGSRRAPHAMWTTLGVCVPGSPRAGLPRASSRGGLPAARAAPGNANTQWNLG